MVPRHTCSVASINNQAYENTFVVVKCRFHYPDALGHHGSTALSPRRATDPRCPSAPGSEPTYFQFPMLYGWETIINIVCRQIT